jgi:hypothetical protein
MALPVLTEGVASHAVWHFLTAAWRRARGNTIHITSPRPQETLTNPKSLYNGGILAYEVHGRLKRRPPEHTIWLLTQYEGDYRVWPHGFDPVKYNKDTGEWHGWINGKKRLRAKIIAVVAPPSSHDFFSYYQAHGNKTNWTGLPRLPPECKNKAEVDVSLQP